MIKSKLQEAAESALKSHDAVRLSTIRMVLSDIHNKEIDSKIDLTDEQVIQVLRSHKKKLEEANGLFAQAQRNDLIEQYKAQIAIIEDFLPQELSDEALKMALQAIVAQNPDANPNALIGICMKSIGSQAASGRVIAMLKEITPSS